MDPVASATFYSGGEHGASPRPRTGEAASRLGRRDRDRFCPAVVDHRRTALDRMALIRPKGQGLAHDHAPPRSHRPCRKRRFGPPGPRFGQVQVRMTGAISSILITIPRSGPDRSSHLT